MSSLAVLSVSQHCGLPEMRTIFFHLPYLAFPTGAIHLVVLLLYCRLRSAYPSYVRFLGIIDSCSYNAHTSGLWAFVLFFLLSVSVYYLVQTYSCCDSIFMCDLVIESQCDLLSHHAVRMSLRL